MRLIMTLVVRDEADIVRENVVFHLEHGVDFVIATDNGSVDGTRDILEDLSRTGLVRVIDEPGDDYSLGRWFTRMALLARDEHAADWILSSDADEFWRASSGDLKSALAETPADADLIVCAARHMLCPHDRAPQGPWHRDLVYRVARPVPIPILPDRWKDPLPAPFFYLDLPPKVLCRARGLKAIHQGNHWADYETEARRASGPVDVYHFPVRSFDQFVTKVRGSGAGYARNTELDPSFGWQKRRWYKMLLDGDIEQGFREALPSERRLLSDLSAGTLVIDRTMTDELERLSGEQGADWLGGILPSRAGHVRSGDEELVKGRVVCVLGMHRSGTSALARTLNLLGVDLGPPRCLMLPDEGNPEGYWEHQGLTDVSDAILRRFGGTWDRPPVLEPGWEQSESLADLRQVARDVLRSSFANATLWGWKDPRTCLTLPFWQSLLPPMRYVITIRSPLSVGRSLARRDGLSIEDSGALWLHYVTSALMHTEGRARLIVSYERLLATGMTEVRRIAAFIGRPAALTPEVRDAIEAAVRPGLSHHGGPLERTLADRSLPFPVQALHAALRLASRQPGEETADEGSVDAAVSALAQASRGAHAKDLAHQRLEGDYGRLREDHRGLADEHQRLRAAYQGLADEYERLRAAYRGLAGEHERVEAAYRGLAGEHGRVEAAYRGLAGEHGRLGAAYQGLQSDHERLRAAYQQLEAAHVRLHEAMRRLRGHPIWRSYLWLRRVTIPRDSRREATVKGVWRWLRPRTPEQD